MGEGKGRGGRREKLYVKEGDMRVRGRGRSAGNDQKNEQERHALWRIKKSACFFKSQKGRGGGGCPITGAGPLFYFSFFFGW